VFVSVLGQLGPVTKEIGLIVSSTY